MRKTKDRLTTDEAARLAGATASWMQVMRVRGLGPAYYKDGWRVFYKREDIAEWLAARNNKVSA